MSKKIIIAIVVVLSLLVTAHLVDFMGMMSKMHGG
jgi:hypothetical protein